MKQLAAIASIVTLHAMGSMCTGCRRVEPLRTWQFIHDDGVADGGVLSEGFYADNHAASNGWSGTLREHTGERLVSLIRFVNGKREGIMTLWHEDGHVGLQGDYIADKKHGEWVTYWDGGVTNCATSYSNGVKTGIFTAWHPNGNMKTRGRFSDDAPVGTWRQWDSTGKALADIPHDNDAAQASRDLRLSTDDCRLATIDLLSQPVTNVTLVEKSYFYDGGSICLEFLSRSNKRFCVWSPSKEGDTNTSGLFVVIPLPSQGTSDTYYSWTESNTDALVCDYGSDDEERVLEFIHKRYRSAAGEPMQGYEKMSVIDKLSALVDTPESEADHYRTCLVRVWERRAARCEADEHAADLQRLLDTRHDGEAFTRELNRIARKGSHGSLLVLARAMFQLPWSPNADEDPSNPKTMVGERLDSLVASSTHEELCTVYWRTLADNRGDEAVAQAQAALLKWTQDNQELLKWEDDRFVEADEQR